MRAERSSECAGCGIPLDEPAYWCWACQAEAVDDYRGDTMPDDR